MPFLMLKYYVIPYQIGTGEILPDGSVNWATAEALITPQTKRNQRILRRACVKEETQKRSKAFSQEIEGYKST